MKKTKEMNLDLIKDGEVKVKEALKDLFDGKLDCVNVKNITPKLFENYVGNYAEIDNDIDFNGWQCDYWYKCEYKNEIYSVFGGAWYGNATIERGIV